ncbi:MAG: hypothetical protein HOV87_18850, partial [Catenulispora sp.]|nr:hypothetical protein [Catenulispora sp.]
MADQSRNTYLDDVLAQQERLESDLRSKRPGGYGQAGQAPVAPAAASAAGLPAPSVPPPAG